MLPLISVVAIVMTTWILCYGHTCDHYLCLA
jgi:hypothetical protein